MGFGRNSRVVVEQVDDANWRVVDALAYEGKHERFTVPAGSGTDFASVPRIFVWLLPRYGRYTKAAILHDYLWRERVSQGEMTWSDADGIFLRAMRELGVPFLRRWVMWAAVRWVALFKARGGVGWSRDAWRVALLTIVAFPIVVPAAGAILGSLLLFYSVELSLWLPLRLVNLVRRLLGRPSPKEVNRPKLEWKSS